MNTPRQIQALDAGTKKVPIRRIPAWLLGDVLAPFLMTRSLLALVGWLALTRLPFSHANAPMGPTNHPWIDEWVRWDSLWYLNILRYGYHVHLGQQMNINFLPLYPALMWIGGLVPGHHPLAAWTLTGLLVSALACLAATGYLVALVRLDHDPATAQRAAFYLLVFPTSLFLSALYADGLCLALTIAAFYHARRGHWWAVGVLAALAALTRPYGFVLVIPLAYEYLQQKRFRWREIRPDAAALALIPAAYAAWAAYLDRLSGDPTLFLTAGNAWGRKLTPPWTVVWHDLHHYGSPLYPGGQTDTPHDFVFTLLFLALVPLTWRWLRPSYALMATLLFLVMISSGMFVSVMRYELALFPCFILLARAGRREWFDRLYVTVAVAFSTLFMVLFALGDWVA